MAEAKKLVHWALDVSVSEFGSPFLDASTSSFASTPNLQYLNSQLVAHGFINAPGISLDGISSADSERVAKCLLSMLSQRMVHLEGFLGFVGSYSLVRMICPRQKICQPSCARCPMTTNDSRTCIVPRTQSWKIPKRKSASANHVLRECQSHQSPPGLWLNVTRIRTSARALQSSEANHKQTTADLQRARSSVQGLRTTHVMELRKKEKEIERMVEKWIKLADAQQKFSAASTGISFYGANAEVVSGSEDVGKGNSYLEVALEHAEAARAELFADSTRLRRLTVMSANRIQSLIHSMRLMASIPEDEVYFRLT